MFSAGLGKWGRACWSHPYCVQGSGTEGWGQTETATEQSGVLRGRVRLIWTNIKNLHSDVLTWNRWPPWRRVAGLRGATGLSVLQKWMLDSRGLGVSNRVGVWGGRWTRQDSVLFNQSLNPSAIIWRLLSLWKQQPMFWSFDCNLWISRKQIMDLCVKKKNGEKDWF